MPVFVTGSLSVCVLPLQFHAVEAAQALYKQLQEKNEQSKSSYSVSALSLLVVIITTTTMFMVLSLLLKATARVYPLHMMDMERRRAAADPQHRPNDSGSESTYWLPEATPTITIYYYYSAGKLILILPSYRG